MKSYSTFKHPYVLLEDARGKCRPLYKEYPKDLPFINLDSPTLCCPFSKATRSQSTKKRNAAKVGYCEICYIKYDDYCEHIVTKGHVSHARNSFNYRKIDEFIRELCADNAGIYDGPLIESPCDRLEKEYSKNNKYNYVVSSESESFIRLSKISSEAGDGVLAFNNVLDKLDKRYSQDK